MIVALLNQKGAVGKTTLALHLAGAWAAPADHDPPVLSSRIGQRVAFADTACTGRLVFDIDTARHAVREIVALAAEVDRVMR